jgi:RNA-directed DNA polymerase
MKWIRATDSQPGVVKLMNNSKVPLIAKMMNAGSKLFASIHKRKRYANPNHDVHLMARNISDWLTQGVQSLINGTYTPRFLKRHYFKDEMVDQLYLADRILQNLLLAQLKPTFAHVMNPNCYHLHGPSGVKLATLRVKDACWDASATTIATSLINRYINSDQSDNLKQYCPKPALYRL